MGHCCLWFQGHVSYLVGELMMSDVEFVQSLEGETPAPQALISECAPHMCFVEAIPLLQETSSSGSCGLRAMRALV